MTHLWNIEVPEKRGGWEPKRLTEGDKFTWEKFSWSPTDTASRSARRKIDTVVGKADCTLCRGATAAKNRDTPGRYESGWSPDGKKIAFETAAGGKYTFTRIKDSAVVGRGGGTRKF